MDWFNRAMRPQSRHQSAGEYSPCRYTNPDPVGVETCKLTTINAEQLNFELTRNPL